MLTLLASLVLITAEPSALTVTTVHGTEGETATAEQLHRLVEHYDIGAWTFTHMVEIDEEAIPHSHPVLTLHARYLENDDALLSTFLHEQFHWFLIEQGEAGEAAMDAFAALYPDIPVGYPDGARDARSNQRHLIVCMLEFDALAELVGEARARAVFEGYGHYREIYRLVLETPDDLRAVIADHGIALPAR